MRQSRNCGGLARENIYMGSACASGELGRLSREVLCPGGGVDVWQICTNTIGPMCAVSSQDDLEMLMVRYQAGDFAAATALIDRVSGQLRRFFVVQFASRADADDLLQETWLRIHRVRHTYRAGEPVLPWFYAIARNVRVDHYRKSARTRAHEQKYEEMLNTKPAYAEAPGEIDSLESLLAGLPESQREAIEMLKVAGMSVEEVARATSTTVGSVKQRVHRAYKRLRQKLEKMGVRKPAGGARP